MLIFGRTNMKIAISGAQGVGKTTLLEELKKEFQEFEFIQGITRTLKNQGFKINKDGNDETQLAILKAHVSNLKKDNFITDRCVLDCTVYTRYLYNRGAVTKEILEKIETALFKNISKYDVIFYIRPEFDIEDDNVRDTDIEFRNIIVDLFDYYINLTEIKPIILSGSVNERVQQFKEELKYFSKK